MRSLLVGVLLLLGSAVLLRAQSCDPTLPREDCSARNEEDCAFNGCCWSGEDEPRCYFQTPKYMVKSIKNTTHGYKLILEAENIGAGLLPGSPISPLTVDIIQETTGRLHIKIYDHNDLRWEVPERFLPVPPPPAKPVTYANYALDLPAANEEFYFRVLRGYYNTTVFDTRGISLFFGNQFLKIGTNLLPNYNLYGLGEHKSRFKLKAGNTYTLWNYDIPDPEDHNLYGSHPFYMEVHNDTSVQYGGVSTHGVFLKNSNGMDVVLGPQSLTYKVIGGVLDFYFFIGSSPDDIIQQYQEVIGRPAIPPYWALGFHQCRYGYNNLDDVKEVVKNFASFEIPLDTVWTDIDYMDQHKDFTTDPVNFPTSEMRKFVDKVHENGQHYVVIIDPGIGVSMGYKAYEDGIASDIFVKTRDGDLFVGKVWPGESVYPDFTNPETHEYWSNQISSFLSQVPVDGLWIDMNEPSNFCTGACDRTGTSTGRQFPNFDPNYPPYNINNQGYKAPLHDKTLDMDALHFDQVTYNVHNIYGFTESIATYNALKKAKKTERPFVLSRSTFPGSGRYVAHWLGDNRATVDDLYYSIAGVLSFQLFGIPFTGADMCGFQGTSTLELCARWMQLGSFYPFSRNHNDRGLPSQEPYRWPEVATISKKYLTIRYSLLPYYYTLFFRAHQDPSDYRFYPSSGVVIKPLFFDFLDKISLDVDTQFLVGDALMICPQLGLENAGMELTVYLPAATWYDWYTHQSVSDYNSGGIHITVDTPLDMMPIYIRGGQIIPMQEPGLTTTESRKNPYSLLVALQSGNAGGGLYLDDGVTFNTSEYTYISYSCNSGELSADVSGTKYATKAKLPKLETITVIGVINRPTIVALDGRSVQFTFTEDVTFKLVVDKLSINMDTSFRLGWM